MPKLPSTSLAHVRVVVIVGAEVASLIAVPSLMRVNPFVANAEVFVPSLSAICSPFADTDVGFGSVDTFESLKELYTPSISR